MAHGVKFSRCRDAPFAFWHLKTRPCSALHAGLPVHARAATCVLESASYVYVCVHEDTFETRMVTVFDHPSSRNDCNPSIRPPKPIYQMQVELAVLSP